MVSFVVSPWQVQCQVNKDHNIIRAFFEKNSLSFKDSKTKITRKRVTAVYKLCSQDAVK